MHYMLCRNRVRDFSKWKSVFESHSADHREAGLKLLHLWRTLEDPNDAFFLFEVDSLEKAKAFIGAPKATDASALSGVIEGEYHFLESAPALVYK